MYPTSRTSFAAVLGIVGMFLLTLSTAFGWNPEIINGVQYIPMSEVRTHYKLTRERTEGRQKVYEVPEKIQIRIQARSQEMFMNNMKFVLSYPVADHPSKGLMVSNMDLHKIIDPVLRPTYIANRRSFNTVVIDPGHGGHDSGTRNRISREADINLSVGKKLRDRLKAMGYQVVMTRDTDNFIALQDRVRIANRHNNAIFISIHFNDGGSSARGVETFTLAPAGTSSSMSRNIRHDALQGNAQDSMNIALATAVQGHMLKGPLAIKEGISMVDRAVHHQASRHSGGRRVHVQPAGGPAHRHGALSEFHGLFPGRRRAPVPHRPGPASAQNALSSLTVPGPPFSSMNIIRIPGLADYQETLRLQEQLVRAHQEDPDRENELLLLEHAGVYTIGRTRNHASLHPGSVLPFPVHEINRGGQATYHGPGQLVGYPITDLNRCGRDLHRYVTTLENTLIETCARFGVQARIREGLVGVWVENRKIASIGVGVKKWIAMHGFALNITRKSLPPFLAITPCGIQGVQMTCLEDEMSSPLPEGNLLKCFGDVFAALWEEKFNRY